MPNFGQNHAYDLAVHEIKVKTECKRRILEVVDLETQTNIAQAGVIYTSLLSEGVAKSEARETAGFQHGDLEAAAMWHQWVKSMRDSAKLMMSDLNAKYEDDASWPAVPDGVEEMASRF